VAELGLGLALSLARQIPQADAAFKRGRERYGLDGNQNADLLSARSIGIVGFGDLGKALLKLLHPFGREIQVFDPWVPARAIQAVATDVWPEEPFDPKHAIRRAESAVLSAHRAGALYSCFYEMGERIVEDIALMNNGLPPSSCKRAEYETVTRMRSRPVQRS
jgi:phosphoglycerate dehydrogenase-like enzyme